MTRAQSYCYLIDLIARSKTSLNSADESLCCKKGLSRQVLVCQAPLLRLRDASDKCVAWRALACSVVAMRLLRSQFADLLVVVSCALFYARGIPSSRGHGAITMVLFCMQV